MEKLNLYLLFLLISLIEKSNKTKSNNLRTNQIYQEDEQEKHPLMPSN